MPILHAVKRRMIEHLSTLINELHIGTDGTVATVDDGGVRCYSYLQHQYPRGIHPIQRFNDWGVRTCISNSSEPIHQRCPK